jgi:hypothetical protein
MHCLLSVVSILIDFGYMHECDWASHAFLPMIPCKGYSLAKIQHHSLSSLIRVPHHYFTYDTEGFRSIVNQKISYGCEQESQDLI